MPTERQWVTELAPRLEAALAELTEAGQTIKVEAHKRLYYAYELHEYNWPEDDVRVSDFQTDLLVYDQGEGKRWTPRVVIECKLGSVTTHDALTYSTKAAAHKNVHPFLRYGILIGHLGESAVPGRLFRHGIHFDFMAAWTGVEPTAREWDQFISVLRDEVNASRQIARMLVGSRLQGRKKFMIVHRPLKFIDTGE